MKRYILFILSFIVLVLAGCASKSSFPITFDKFTFTVYDNNKEYVGHPIDTIIAGMKILTEMKEKVGTGYTGFSSSLIIVKTPVQSGIDIKTLVDSNTNNLKLKLVKYIAINNLKKKVQCTSRQYSGYITTFSYQLDKQKIYGGQYFFTDNELVYIISLHSADKKDMSQFIKSIATIKCIP